MEDNNKLIAEFMGLETPDGIYFEYLTKDGHRSELTHFMLLKYHLEWNWLMSVVDKIQSIEDGYYCVTIDHNVCTIWNEDFTYNESEISYSTMDAVYKAVVLFINWYNELGEYDYSCTSENIYASFDYGTVLASNIKEATRLAKKKILYDLKKCNDALEHCDITVGFKVEMNLDELKVTKR